MYIKLMNKIKIALFLIYILIPFIGYSEPWPIAPTDQKHEIWNNYGEFQEYSNNIYMHNGIDIPANEGEIFYAVGTGLQSNSQGYKYVYDPNQPKNSEIEAGDWKYSHVLKDDQNAPNLNEGRPWQQDDDVYHGDAIGVIADFDGWNPLNGPDHVHLTNLNDENPLELLSPNQDSVYPTIKELLFREASSEKNDNNPVYYTTEVNGKKVLYGNVDIIAKAYDEFIASSYKLNIYSIGFKVLNSQSQTVLPYQELVKFTKDFTSNINDEDITQTIYENDNKANSEDHPWFNYKEGNFYYILTNNDGNGIIETTDADYYWNTNVKNTYDWNTQDAQGGNADATYQGEALFPDGEYIIKTIAYDQQNHWMEKKDKVIIDNYVPIAKKVLLY